MSGARAATFAAQPVHDVFDRADVELLLGFAESLHRSAMSGFRVLELRLGAGEIVLRIPLQGVQKSRGRAGYREAAGLLLCCAGRRCQMPDESSRLFESAVALQRV